MITDLTAKGYIYNSDLYKDEFEAILSQIVKCYIHITNKGDLIPNNENLIRDRFLSYLKDDHYKSINSPLMNYHFDKETQENTGRADIRILPINPYKGDKAYYVIECKRLDNIHLDANYGLNAKYVKNGICRFVTEYYSSFYDKNGMLAFVVSPMNIDENVNSHINRMLNKDMINDKNEPVNAMAAQVLLETNISNGFPYAYTSKHLVSNHQELTLYHLLFDFSPHIH